MDRSIKGTQTEKNLLTLLKKGKWYGSVRLVCIRKLILK